ncbi:MAG: RNA polymerase sigma factor [Acidobacteriota bacterium]
MSRSNCRWLADLRGRGLPQHEALEALRHVLLRGLRGAIRGADEAFLEDVVQEAQLRILDRLEQFAGRSRFETWATAIAIRIAFDEMRRRRWADISLDSLLATGSNLLLQGEQAAAPERGAERSELVSLMYELIHHQLTAKQRTALMAELHGMPQGEIARHLGSNRNAVYKLTHDARKRLKRGLEAAGYRPLDIAAAFSP